MFYKAVTRIRTYVSYLVRRISTRLCLYTKVITYSSTGQKYSLATIYPLILEFLHYSGKGNLGNGNFGKGNFIWVKVIWVHGNLGKGNLGKVNLGLVPSCSCVACMVNTACGVAVTTA